MPSNQYLDITLLQVGWIIFAKQKYSLTQIKSEQ